MSLLEEERETTEESVSTEIKPEEILEQIIKSDAEAREHEEESIMPSSTSKKRLFIYDELLYTTILKRYLDKPHMEMRVRATRWRLNFPKFFPPINSGLPSIERTENSEGEVWGITIDISNQDLSKLNRYKGAPNRYHMRNIWVMDRGGLRYPAMCYVVSVPDEKPSKPSVEMLNSIIVGAKERRLPASYIEFLQSLETL